MLKVVEDSSTTEFAGLLGKKVALFGLNYIYYGKLVGANDNYVVLENAAIVYETGSFSNNNWKDAQPLPISPWYVRTSCIESYGEADKG